MSEPAELVQVVSQLRQDLTDAMRSGADAELAFELGPVELELTVAVEKQAGPNAKVRLWVLEAGASGKVGSTSTHRVKLTMEPRIRGQLDQRPFISGSSAPDER